MSSRDTLIAAESDALTAIFAAVGAVDSRHPAGTRSAAFGLAGSTSAVVLVLVEEID